MLNLPFRGGVGWFFEEERDQQMCLSLTLFTNFDLIANVQKLGDSMPISVFQPSIFCGECETWAALG